MGSQRHCPINVLSQPITLQSLHFIMSNKQGRRARSANKAQPTDVDVTVRLSLSEGVQLEEHQLSACPVVVSRCCSRPEELNDAPQQQQDITLQLETWSQLPPLLSWFSSTVLPLDASAKLSFPASLPKELRADVHNHVSKKLSKVCQSVSEGVGEERYVAVVAKGAVRPSCRRWTAEQQDHAMALWLLWKQHSKAQQKLQQQQQQQSESPQRQQPDSQQQQHTEHADQLQDVLLDQLTLRKAGGAATDDAGEQPPSTALQDAAALAQCSSSSGRQYSRDEVLQMLAEGSLTDELLSIWQGPAGVEQRAARLLCLAAAAGDLEDVQELVSAHPQLVPSAVHDLSAGGALPLHLAAAGGHVEVVQALLGAGAPVEAKDGKGLSALQVAQRSEQCDVEAVLMQAGAVDSRKDGWGL